MYGASRNAISARVTSVLGGRHHGADRPLTVQQWDSARQRPTIMAASLCQSEACEMISRTLSTSLLQACLREKPTNAVPVAYPA